MSKQTSITAQVVIAVVCTFLALGALFWAFTAQSQEFDRLARCIIQQQAESRQVSRSAHDDLKTAHGLERTPSDVFPPPVPDDPEACVRFVERRGQVPIGAQP